MRRKQWATFSLFWPYNVILDTSKFFKSTLYINSVMQCSPCTWNNDHWTCVLFKISVITLHRANISNLVLHKVNRPRSVFLPTEVTSHCSSFLCAIHKLKLKVTLRDWICVKQNSIFPKIWRFFFFSISGSWCRLWN